MKKLTVFTPSYNRAVLLPRLYESLCRQTSKEFLWLIVDDGSTDETKELVEKWQNENRIEIQYVYKENGGMHTGHNTAYSMIETELNVCIDSDDFMPDNAVELILNKWKNATGKEKLAGIVGLDADKDGNIIGTKIPENLERGSVYRELYNKKKITGDKKFVLRTDVVRQYPAYPEYKAEKLVPLGILYLMIEQDYDYLYSNEVYCIVEYQAGGSSNTIFRQYKESPKGFAYARKIHIKYAPDLKNRFKSYCHLISSSLFAKDLSIMMKDVNPVLTLLTLPFGIFLNILIRTKIKN